MRATKTQKLVSGHARNSLIHISPLSCHEVFPGLQQEIMKVREVIPHTGPIPIVIPLKLFLDLLRDLVFPRGLTDSQSHVLIFTNIDS